MLPAQITPAKFLLTIWPWKTHIYPNLALAHSLRSRGHQVAFYTGSAFRQQIESEGFAFFPFDNLDAGRTDGLLASLIEHWNRPWKTRVVWRQFLVDTMPAQLEDLHRILPQWKPDALVCDMAMWGPLLVLRETTALPIAVLAHVGYCMLPGDAGIHPGVMLRLPWARFNRLYGKAASRLIAAGTSGIRKAASAVRAKYGLPPLTAAAVEYIGQVPLYLVPSVPEFDARGDRVPPSVRYTGPCLWEDPRGSRPPAAGAIREHGPAVLVIEPSLHGAKSWLLETAERALAGQPFSVYLAPAAGNGYTCRCGGANVRVLDAAHLGAWIAAADVIVTHGSSEAVLPALGEGKPLVVTPAVLEEHPMAWRVTGCGAGLRLPARRVTPERLRAAVRRILSEPAFRENARRMQQALARASGPETAAKLLEEMVHSGRPDGRAATPRRTYA